MTKAHKPTPEQYATMVEQETADFVVEVAARKLADEIRAYAGWPARGATHYKRPTPDQLAAKARVDKDFDALVAKHMSALANTVKKGA